MDTFSVIHLDVNGDLTGLVANLVIRTVAAGSADDGDLAVSPGSVTSERVSVSSICDSEVITHLVTPLKSVRVYSELAPLMCQL